MQIVEVKNNLVQICYDTTSENLILSGFVLIKDVNQSHEESQGQSQNQSSGQSFIGQIIHLEANTTGNFAVIKLLFTFDSNGVITNYNGSIPSTGSLLDIVYPQELLELLPVKNPIVLGELAQQKTVLKLDLSMFEEKLLVCSEKDEDNKLLAENFAAQLAYLNKKVLVIDLEGNLNFSPNKIMASKDFKLPLNYETINFIYDKGLDGAKAETKAFLQEIFLEVQEYVKNLPEKFIPFETFKNVVDGQYQETSLIELVLLKNKLLKYYEAGIFAQEKNEFETLEDSLSKKETTILDLSRIDEELQREMISYAYSLISQSGKEVYVIFNVNNSNSDKKLLKQIFTTKQAYTVPICSYSYKYLKELKQLAKNLILFAPLQQQNDFAGYNVFLNKLNAHEFIIYGHTTHNLPLIVRLESFKSSPSEEVVEDEIPTQSVEEDLLDEEIKRDVDEIFTATQGEKIDEEIVDEELTDEDLDLLDDLNIEGVNDILQEEDLLNNISIEEEPSNKIEVRPSLNQPQPAKVEAEKIEDLSNVQYQQTSPVVDILPANLSSVPVVPIYSADIEPQAESDKIEQGDVVMHAKYGKGIVEKLISYGSKTLCSIQFDNVGRRLLDPTLAEIKKVE